MTLPRCFGGLLPILLAAGATPSVAAELLVDTTSELSAFTHLQCLTGTAEGTIDGATLAWEPTDRSAEAASAALGSLWGGASWDPRAGV